MHTNEPTILEIIRHVLQWGSTLVGILALVGVLWLTIRWLARRWRTQAGELLKRVRADLSSAEQGLAERHQEAAAYPTRLAPPYRASAQQLHETLDRLTAGLADAQAELSALTPPSRATDVELESRSAGKVWDRVRDLLWREPQGWRRRRARLKALDARLETLESDLSEADELLRDLRGKPLVVAQKARALRATLEVALGVVGDLRTAGIHGEHLSEIADRLQAHEREIESLPAYLFESDSHVARQAQPGVIIEVWRTLEARQSAIYEYADRLEGWRQAYAKFGHDLDSADQAVEGVATSLARAHPSVDVTEISAALSELRMRVRELTSRYRSPTPADLERLNEIEHVTREANRLVGRLASLEALRVSLDSKLSESSFLLDEIERQLRQLAEASRYPLDGVPIQAEVDRVRQQITELQRPATAQDPTGAEGYTQQQLESGLASAQVLYHRAQALGQRASEARENRRRLIELLDAALPGSGATQGNRSDIDWLTWAHDLHERTSAYAAANWAVEHQDPASTSAKATDQLRVAALLADAQELKQRQERWIPERIDDLLQPDTLAQRVREVGAVFKDIEALQNRLDGATRMYQRLQRTEEEARSKLESAYGALDRLEVVAASILPEELAKEENHWSEIRAHLKTGYTLGVALRNRESGAVWDKAAKVESWVQASHATVEDWRRRLEQELRAAAEALTADLDELAAIAPLDGEPAVEVAREALAALATPSMPEPPSSHAPIIRLTAAVAEQLRTLSRLDKAAAVLEADVIDPLTEPIRRWRAAQTASEEALRNLRRLQARSARQWPPVSCDVETVETQAELAGREQKALQRSGSTVADVINRVTDLTQRYQRIVAMVDARREAYETLRPQLDAVLDRLERWSSDLETYAKHHQADGMVVAAIRARLDEIESAWTQLQVAYDQRRAPLRGPDTLRDLENLWRQARRDIPVGAGIHVIPASWIAGEE